MKRSLHTEIICLNLAVELREFLETFQKTFLFGPLNIKYILGFKQSSRHK